MKQLLSKDDLLAKIGEKKAQFKRDIEDGYYPTYYCALLDLEDMVNSLEVKEVNLDFQRFAKEMEAVFSLPYSETENTEENPMNWEFAIAKHFFELGLKYGNKS